MLTLEIPGDEQFPSNASQCGRLNSVQRVPGSSVDGERDVLVMWVGHSGGEGAKTRMNMLTVLRLTLR